MSRSQKEIWPCGRYEVYVDHERLNGFHTREEADECVEQFPGSLVIDRADRFCYGPNDRLVRANNHD